MLLEDLSLVLCIISVVRCDRVFYMEPPDCRHNITLEKDEVVYLESSNRSHVQNQEGECYVRLENQNKSKHLMYIFEMGPNITDCSTELILSHLQNISPKYPLPRYTCNNYHIQTYKQAHADSWAGLVTVKRPYVTLRKDFFFRIRVEQIEPWGEHADNGLGFYVDKTPEAEPGIPYVLYTILALDFLIPTLIFIINEFSARMEARAERQAELLHQQSRMTSMMATAFPATAKTTDDSRNAISSFRQNPAMMNNTPDGSKALFPYAVTTTEKVNKSSLVKRHVTGPCIDNPVYVQSPSNDTDQEGATTRHSGLHIRFSELNDVCP